MNNDKPTGKLPTAREILRGRKFGLKDALSREASGVLKGASPIAAHEQAIFGIRALLEKHLVDPEGSLRSTLVAAVDSNPPLVASHQGDAGRILSAVLNQTLASQEALSELVRKTDARWGRDYVEKPHFEREGQPADPADPYTLDGVRHTLERLQRALPS